MVFKGTQANISDANGNLLMSSNGVWIANATGDTMMNGSGLNPGWDASNYPYGLLWNHANLILPLPADSNKLALFHQAYLADVFTYNFQGGVYYSLVDLSQNGGLGSVIIKNDTIILDKISAGMTACRHANGRDWWIIAQKDSSDIVYKILLTTTGIASVTTQNLGYNQYFYGNGSQITFSKDGTKFIQTNYTYIGANHPSYLIVSNFDRCNGMFDNVQIYQVTDDDYLWGLAFSPSGKYAYACSSNYIFQIDTDNQTVDTVAVYDGFISPPGFSCCATTFWGMYLAANGKIYITSGSGVQHLHEMNYPDSAGVACDVQQHSISLGYAQLRSVPNHPNYYLGCDTTLGCTPCYTNVDELSPPDFKFRVYPNPVNDGILNIGYLLPQNKHGIFEMYDITGKVVFRYTLPPWSNYQNFKLPQLSDGIYQCVITSDGKRVSKKVAIVKE
ncbi:MAG: T9SS type A sorting domain-containing protein [Bacteroidia bacterium]|nr:T9SS type A sorting domain-containing protein [Bacteroidia bacterium]